MSRDDVIQVIAEACATMEGYYDTTTLAFKNNNPGNLMGWGMKEGIPVDKRGYTIFATPQQGWRALRKQVSAMMAVPKITIFEMFAGKKTADGRVIYAGYAPASIKGNDPAAYAHFVVDRLNTHFGCGWTESTWLEKAIKDA